MKDFILAQHIDKMAKLKTLGKERDIPKYITKQPNDVQDILNVWASYLLDKSSDKILDKDLPLSSQCKINAWQAFYQQDYIQAHCLFKQAMSELDWKENALNSSLGMAKVYTRTGHWHLARQWCLYYLSMARQALDHFDIAKGYGALAEIFLRAGQSKEALACFQMAYHLMPLQSGQKARQYNYMASALLRHGEFLRAEALLYSGYQEAKRTLQSEPNDSQISILHSQMRFEFLYLLSKKYHSDAKHYHQEAVDGSMNHLKRMPCGMILMAQGIQMIKQQSFDKASVAFQGAMQTFTKQLLLEYLWANRLYQYCQNQLNTECQIDEGVLLNAKSLLSIEQISPPDFKVVLDKTWQQVQLHNQGFDLLLNFDLNQQELLDLWQLFFI